jgi:pyrroline-5-carboxylate reductase
MSIDLQGKLVLLGAGKMGGAMLQGWLAAGVPSNKIVALDPSPPIEVKSEIETAGISLNPSIAELGKVDVLIAAVKPQMMDEALVNVKVLAASHPLVLSIAAGKTISYFESHFGSDAAVIRAMPNTPAAIARGITAIAGNAHVSPRQWALAKALLTSVGEVVQVEDESDIDAVTAVSGSGPAYIFYLTECMTAAGIEAGLSPELATALARATVSGSGELMRVSGLDAATLRQNVTSPKGTTYEALQVLMAEDTGMKPLMIKAIAAAKRRSKELSA